MLRIFWFCVLLYLVGFIAFATNIVTIKNEDVAKYDAIIVLTGDSGRIKIGREMLKNNVANQLFITGVESNMLVETNRVILGRTAQDTYGNAREIAQWEREYNLKTAIIITSDYHILRAIAVIKNKSPNLKITPYIVENRDKSSPTFYWLLFSEYNKFLFVKVENWFAK